ncbi:conserved hypothetical protein [Sporisorium reilianum SRZ2]|uniref:Uncharacterized protein n=1 Tax=Sporisorium reilianum (strain SRZ2) TaxID=999809 RepID=E6ZXJ9_SPORE|nr:conserved hypothetical protein [Sporisorium reilianum SRZ2]
MASMSSSSLPSSTELWQLLEARRPSPLRFALHLSRRPNAALCPCLQTHLLTRTGSFTVTRILDPEHRVPYISLSPLFHAAGLTLVQGLLHFDLGSSSFDLSLAGLEPWDDLWASLPLARSIASSLKLDTALAAMLDARTSAAWSLDERERGVSHNWRVPQQWVDAAGYSTDAITRVAFERVEMLRRGQQVATLVSGEMRERIVEQARERRGSAVFGLHQRLVRWSAHVVAVWQDVQAAAGEQEGREEKVWGLLEDLRNAVLPPTSTDVLEWLQLVSPPTDGASTATERLGSGASSLLAPLTLAELSAQRTTEPALGQLLPTPTQDLDEIVAQLESILRSKLASLHHMNLVSLPHLASLHDDVSKEPEHLNAQQHAPSTPSYPALTRQPEPASATAANRDNEVAQLSAKVDQIMGKLDRLLASETARQAASASKPVFEKQRQLDDTLRPPISTEPPLAVPTAEVNLLSPLHTFETSPSLLVIVLCVVLAFIAIKSTSE